MKVAIACDHGGYALKADIVKHLQERGVEVVDFGCGAGERVDYPLYGAQAARAVADGSCDRGIVICTTGIGISITANKIKGIRCALCRDAYSAEMTRRHNDANMLAMGGGFTGAFEAFRIVDTFLDTEFEGGRHKRRVDMIMALEED